MGRRQQRGRKIHNGELFERAFEELPPLEEMYNMAGLSLPKIVAPQKEDDKEEEEGKE